MPIKAKLASLDGLDPSIAGLYRPEGDAFVLDVEPVDGLNIADTARHQAETGKLKQDLAAKDARITELAIESEARQAITRAGGSEKLLLHHVTEMLTVHNGQVVAKGADGKPRVTTVPGSTDPMGAAELLKEMQGDADFKLAFGNGRPNGATGTVGPHHRARQTPLY